MLATLGAHILVQLYGELPKQTFSRMHRLSTQELCNAKESLSIVKCYLLSMGT